tara:strand:- start:1209 stop:1838 length:630 start_codon:yes stop_codon:yes gene_type:complete
MGVQIPIAVFLAGQMGKELIKRVGRTAAEKIAKNPKKRADFVKAREKEQMAKSRKKMDTMRKAQKDAMKEASYKRQEIRSNKPSKGDRPTKAVDELMMKSPKRRAEKNMSRMKDGGKIYLSPGVKEAAKMVGKKVPKTVGKKMSYPEVSPGVKEAAKMVGKKKGPTTKKTNGTPKKYKGMMGGGKVMKYSMGGKIDGIALRGKTRGRNR